MFGKTHDSDTLEGFDGDHGFFGDEAAAAEAVEVHDLRDRVEQVEAQVNSQFTSLATYAQIAQEQVELARAEARTSTERSEQRLTSLVERERADRIASFTGSAPAGTAPEFSARLDALEHSVAQIRKGLDECMARQKALADAITAMFERQVAPTAATADVPTDDADTTTDDDAAAIDDADAPAVTAFSATPATDDADEATDEATAEATADAVTPDDTVAAASDVSDSDDDVEADPIDEDVVAAVATSLPAPGATPLAPPSAAIPASGPIADLSLEN